MICRLRDLSQQLKVNRGHNRRRAANASFWRNDSGGGDLQKCGDCVVTPADAPYTLGVSRSLPLAFSRPDLALRGCDITFLT